MGIALRLSSAGFVALVLAAAAHAGPLYRSVDRDGRVTFSDVPIDGAVTVERIASSESAKAAEAAGSVRSVALADSLDEAIARANEKVDLAEHALAVARSALVEDNPLSLPGPGFGRAERQQLEFFKRDVAAARRNLLRTLSKRNSLAPQRPLA